jgi:hypothetical protein
MPLTLTGLVDSRLKKHEAVSWSGIRGEYYGHEAAAVARAVQCFLMAVEIALPHRHQLLAPKYRASGGVLVSGKACRLTAAGWLLSSSDVFVNKQSSYALGRHALMKR